MGSVTMGEIGWPPLPGSAQRSFKGMGPGPLYDCATGVLSDMFLGYGQWIAPPFLEDQPLVFRDIMQHEYANPFGAEFYVVMAPTRSIWHDSGWGYHNPP